MKIFLSTLMVLAFIGAVFMMTRGESSAPVADGNNVSFEGEKQIVDLTARGGYSPEKSIAKAGIPTILRFTTNGLFDCSSFVRIPAMSVSKSLVSSGTTDIDLGIPEVGILRGSCGMGMYPFEINFQN
ncbi:cupredoxin domain-containing protein [Patescibacteria group bacterium]|nr:cupredoxin domain-containing protein [Patescibacteria group bacterium]